MASTTRCGRCGYLRDEIGRDDIHCIFMGARRRVRRHGRAQRGTRLADIVEFPGRVSDEFVQRCLSTADVCLSPDPKNPLNDVSTMNKVVEYMAMGRPIVSFDLAEARVSAGDAAVYVAGQRRGRLRGGDRRPARDPERRAAMGAIGRDRVERQLSWEISRQELLNFYDRLLSGRRLVLACIEIE